MLFPGVADVLNYLICPDFEKKFVAPGYFFFMASVGNQGETPMIFFYYICIVWCSIRY